MRRGRLKVYLGAAPGVGKTYRMLDEGHRRARRGTDVVVGYAECHGRPHTEDMLRGLEQVPRTWRAHRGVRFPELDLDAVLARAPRVALVDELAHTNVPGGRHAKRWQDVEELLAAGVDVVTTVNVQHLESLNDVVQKITGVPQRETVPDEVVRRADQIELVDMPAEALRRRLAHGDVYAPEKVDAALSHYFRVGNLTALRELALLWVAGRVDEALQKYRTEHGIGGVWETRERVVVGLTGGPEGATLIRRAARIADRSAGGDLLAVHVARSDGLAGASPAALARQRALVESLGGTFHSVVGGHVPTALLDFARAENATQLVIGTSRRGRLARFVTGRGVGETTVERSGAIDVHMVTHERAGRGRLLPAAGGGLTPVRKIAGPAAGLVLPALLTLVLGHVRGDLNLTSQALLFLLAVVGVACIGGVASALLAAVTASLLLNWFFIPPVHRFTVGETNNALALGVFAVVAVTVAAIVDRSLRLSRRAAAATAEAETLSSLAGGILRGDHTVALLLERTREAFGMDSAELVEAEAAQGAPAAAAAGPGGTGPGGGAWSGDTGSGGGPGSGGTGPGGGPGSGGTGPGGGSGSGGTGSGGGSDRTGSGAAGGSASGAGLASGGSASGSGPGSGSGSGSASGGSGGGGVVSVGVGAGQTLVLRGRDLAASERRVLVAFAGHVAAALERARLAEAAAEVEPVRAADRLRTALLAAVSHDLRTPLAAGWAAVSSLRSRDVDFTAAERDELLATAEQSLTRLARLVDNLLDMSRLQAGALTLDLRPTALAEIAPAALDDLASPADSSAAPGGVVVRGLDAVPEVLADPALLERVVANLAANAVRHSPAGTPVLVSASALGDRVELRIADHGPGLAPEDRDRVFEPFQRLGDTDNTTGLGLGLALSRGLAEAMDGTLTPEDTPGGGLTMVVSLPAAPRPPSGQGEPSKPPSEHDPG